MADQPEILLPDASGWRAWLEENHAVSDGVWLVLGKQGGSVTTLTYAQALEDALCFGWIDGQARRRDEVSYLQKMTPRRARSMWSARNVGLVARLEQEGRMTEAGRDAVRAAQADGRWDKAYGGSADMEPPADLLDALAHEPRAAAMFDVLTRTNRFAVIFRVTQAKRPETRARRIARFVESLARGETPYPQRRLAEG